MIGDDLRRMQDNFLSTSKEILLKEGHLRPMGFVVTLQKHVDKLFESGYGVEFLVPARDVHPHDDVAVLIVDLAMSWKRLYHAVLNVYPKMQDVLPKLLRLGQDVGVDDPYKRLMRPFLDATQLDQKDVVAATMRQICDKADAFACILHSEAWMRRVDRSDAAAIERARQEGLSRDAKSFEVVVSSMETHDFARTITVPIHREPSADSPKRDAGKVVGFGESAESGAIGDGRLTGFLKPLPEAS